MKIFEWDISRWFLRVTFSFALFAPAIPLKPDKHKSICFSLHILYVLETLLGRSCYFYLWCSFQFGFTRNFESCDNGFNLLDIWIRSCTCLFDCSCAWFDASFTWVVQVRYFSYEPSILTSISAKQDWLCDCSKHTNWVFSHFTLELKVPFITSGIAHIYALFSWMKICNKPWIIWFRLLI